MRLDLAIWCWLRPVGLVKQLMWVSLGSVIPEKNTYRVSLVLGLGPAWGSTAVLGGDVLIEVFFVVDGKDAFTQAPRVRRALERTDTEPIAKQQLFVKRSWDLVSFLGLEA